MQRLALLGILALALAAAAPAGAVPRHVHSIETPAGTHEFGGGVSLHAPCVAFLNLHQNVHVGVFLAGKNPNGIEIEIIEGEC